MSMLTRFAALGGGAVTYVDDVFNTYLYTGNGSTQTITTGLDTLTDGGTIWFKGRQSLAGGTDNQIILPDANPSNDLFLNTASAASTGGTTNLSRTTTGFTLNSAGTVNFNTQTFTAWSFKKRANFFDVVTYTGNGTGSSRTLNHSLGSTPGLYVIKATSTTGDWYVGVPSLGVNYWINLNSNANAGNNASYWQSATSTTFGPQNTGGSNILNVNGVSYVAYLFANDTATDGFIRSGSFTTDGSGNATVTLNWEPQFLLVRASSVNGDWIMLDSMRGWNLTTADARLLANSSGAESTATDYGNPTATGFDFKGGSASATYIYVAIRRSNKPPTTASSVFGLGASTSGTFDNVFPGQPTMSTDLAIVAKRGGATNNFQFADRLRGFGPDPGSADASTTPTLSTAGTAAEAVTGSSIYQIDSFLRYRAAGSNNVSYGIKRARGFFDEVCYAGTGAGQTVTHNLGVSPELVLIKKRTSGGVITGNWYVYAPAILGVSTILLLNSSNGTTGDGSMTSFSAANFVLNGNALSESSQTYAAFLFASYAGISKVGSYTGNGGTVNTNGTSQTINCGFTTGARFVLIKRTDSTGDWYVFDSARGIVAASDPYLLANSTAAEVTTVDAVDADTSGFIVNQTSGTNLNVTSATYIYLAIA